MVELPRVIETAKNVFKMPEADWTCRYIFLLWISLLIQCPFDLKRVFRNEAWNHFYCDFIENTVQTRFLLENGGAGGKELQAAAILLANFLKRPSEAAERAKFLNWCLEQCNVGVLTTLVQLGKAADDTILLPHFDQLYSIVDSINCDSTYSSKLALKLQARLAQLQVKQPGCGKSLSLGTFFAALKHRDTVIRWTAAKALRRIVSSLSSQAAGQVCKMLLDQLEAEFNSVVEASPHALHGLFLAIGQLLNYRFFASINDHHVLDSRFTDLIVKGLKFDQIKGSYSVGSFVRDAACYVAWSLARYSSHLIPRAQDHKIIAGLTCMALFDREVAGRRAASAALQEFIGRIGGDRQGSYLPILTHVHFFSVASLEKSFRTNALTIAQDLSHLIVPDLISHLLQVSLFNFDRNVRKLAAETLGDLYSWDQSIARQLVQIHQKSDDLFAMHGALLAMAALPCDPITPVIEISLQSDRIPAKSLGADLLLEGMLTLISAVSIKSNQGFHLNSWLQAVTSGLKSRSDDLRKSAISALQSISCNFADSLEEFYLNCLTGIERERDVNYQKGLLGALSSCSDSFFSKHRSVIIKMLLKTAKTTMPINDIEKRCVAIESLETLITRHKFDLAPVTDCLTSSLLCDYSIDTRGDVGSKVRLAALKLVQHLPKSPDIDDLVLEQAFSRLDRLRTPAMAVFASHACSVEEFARELLKLPSIPLRGAFRGLIFSCGGLDPEMTENAREIIKQFTANWGSGEFQATALSALADERLCLPVILTCTNLLADLSTSFIADFCKNMIDFVILKSSNIRKLIPAFTLLLQVNAKSGLFSEFLLDQGRNHKFPVIRQLITKE